ncbi:MAG: hypothetical protein WB615_09670 [Candidatus Tumulicola sp.]
MAIGVSRDRDSAVPESFVDASLSALGIPEEYGAPQEYDRVAAIHCGVMSADDLTALMTFGATMTEDEAMPKRTRWNEAKSFPLQRLESEIMTDKDGDGPIACVIFGGNIDLKTFCDALGACSV